MADSAQGASVSAKKSMWEKRIEYLRRTMFPLLKKYNLMNEKELSEAIDLLMQGSELSDRFWENLLQSHDFALSKEDNAKY